MFFFFFFLKPFFFLLNSTGLLLLHRLTLSLCSMLAWDNARGASTRRSCCITPEVRCGCMRWGDADQCYSETALADQRADQERRLVRGPHQLYQVRFPHAHTRAHTIFVLAEMHALPLRSFASQKPTESLRTKKLRQAFYSPEPDFWFILVPSSSSICLAPLLTLSCPVFEQPKHHQRHRS